MQGKASYEALELNDIDPYASDWLAPLDGDDVDVHEDPLLTNEQLAEFEMEANDWNVEVVACEKEEHERSQAPLEAPIAGHMEAPIEDVSTTSAAPTQQQQSLLSLTHRSNL